MALALGTRRRCSPLALSRAALPACIGFKTSLVTTRQAHFDNTDQQNSDFAAYWQNIESRSAFWKKIPRFSDISVNDFRSYAWQKRKVIERQKVLAFLEEVVPDTIPAPDNASRTVTRTDFIEDVMVGRKRASMDIRITPYIASLIDWTSPYQDPLFRQFFPAVSTLLPDHPNLSLDSLGEKKDSPVKGLVHRYPDKVLFTVTSMCPTYCRFCTRSYAIGPNVDGFKKDPPRTSNKVLADILAYVGKNPQIRDVVVSGGDAYMIEPARLEEIGESLLAIPHIRNFRIASKGLSVCPARIIDPDDAWAPTLIRLSKKGRELGKEVAFHTHINHPREITWMTELAALRLFRGGVQVRNQAVLLKGVNDSPETMSELIAKLADMMIIPYYVYMCDMVNAVEDMRTTLQTALDIQHLVRGSTAGFFMPQFVVDLPDGGGKRPVNSFKSYNRQTGLSVWEAPTVKAGKLFEYYDPAPTFKMTNDVTRSCLAGSDRIQDAIVISEKVSHA